MTASSVPDGISFADLQSFAKDAPDDSAIVPTGGPFDGLSEEELKDLVDAWLENMHETNGHPMFAKAIVWRIINNMVGLVNIPHVIRTRDTSRINMPLIYVCILNVSIWLVYALIVVDPFMTASNGLGWVFNVIQGLFYHWAEGNITA